MAWFFLNSAIPSSAAVLTLLDWSTIPVPPGAHPDLYMLPPELMPTAGKTITAVDMDYRNLPWVLGDHPIETTAFLFAPADVLSNTVFESTSQRYWARVELKPSSYLTQLGDPSAPAFVAMHGAIGGGSLTSAQWTVTYSDSTTATANNGIIPEPNCTTLVAFSVSLCLFGRRVVPRG